MAEEVIGLLFGVEGGGSIDGKSGKQIVKDLTKIVNQINGGKSTVPKVKLKFDVSEAKKAVAGLKKELKNLEKMGKIKVTHTQSKSGSGKGSTQSDDVKAAAANYRKLTASVKEYHSALAEAERIKMKSSAVSESGGTWATTDDQYKQRIDHLNTLKEQYDALNVAIGNDGKVQIATAKELGITEEQRLSLINQIQSAMTQATLSTERSAASMQAAWDKNAAKVHEYIQRMREVASKNPDVKRMMDELDSIATSNNPKNLDALTEGFTRLQQKIRETGADVETWGQKMSKTLGTRIRSLLAGIVVGKITQYLREIYTNVVNIDKATTNLQIATGKTRVEVKALIKEYAQLGKQLGATTTEVAEGADTWLRQGHSVADTNTLVKNSTMLAKLGQMEAAESSKALTSAMKGYKVEVEDSIRIVDKMTAVDMEAAASAGDIATAMAETATSADIAGVSMDKLIGYIATVKEVTQDGAESVGTFYKTLFARMNNVAAGKFIDDETGESLNDVETVLGELGIKLRDLDGQFRNSGDVLDEVASRWESFDSVAQHAIATAFAGTRQQEKFIVLMENYGSALGYAETAANSAGTAMEKYAAYTDSIEGKVNSLKAAFEELSVTVLNSELITGTVEFITWLLEALSSIVDAVGGLNTVLYATVAIVAILKADAIVTFIMSIGTAVMKLIGFITSLIASIKIAKAEGITMGQFIKNAFYQITAGATTAQVAVAAFVAVISVALIVVNTYNQSVQESIQNSLSAADAANAEAEAHQKNAKSLAELIQEYKELADKNGGGAFDDKAAKQVETIQDKITKLVGAQADNLNLVNGKLDEEIKKLLEIAELQGASAKDKAVEQMADAEKAYRDKVGAFDWGASDEYRIYGTGGLVVAWGLYDPDDKKNYLDDVTKQYTTDYGVSLEQHNDNTGDLLGMNRDYYFALQSEFENMEDFIAQYERIAAMKTALANAGESDSYLYEEAGQFLSDFQSIYDSYKSGALLIEEIENTQKEIDDMVSGGSDDDGFTGVSVALKSAYTILEEVQDGYDGLASALTDVTSEGYLTADALETLFKLEEDNALAGLKLADILTRDANGYKLAGDALQQYVQALIAQYTITEAFASLQDKENAIANLKTLQAVLATLAQTQEESTDADKARREELEKQQDAYNDQLDAYRELIDLRKDLLQTYEEELSYQKELAKRQRNVTALQTKLSVARLDQSAAGQARVRELEAELKEAQDDLEDFTLEHAIDVLSNQLESQYAEYEAFIKSKLDEITALLEGLDTTPEVNITTDTTWVKDAISQIETLITDTEGKEVVEPSADTTTTGGVWKSYQDAANAGFSNIRTAHEFARGGSDKEKYGTYAKYLEAMYEKYVGSSGAKSTTPATKTKSEEEKIAEKIVKFGSASGSGMNAGKSGDNGIIKWGDKEYKVQNSGTTFSSSTPLYKAAVSILGFGDRQIFGYNGKVYGYLDGHIQEIEGRALSKKGYNNFVSDMKTNYGVYHSGGFVGDVATLASNEEFAKLLKGEFVTTPVQMKRFMEETLPQIVNYANSGGNEFNAPLIEILCENVTSESLPELERVVNEAVKEIKKQLDSGMSRTGYKRQATKRLT